MSSYVDGVGLKGGKILTGGIDHEGRWLIRPTIVTDLPLTASAYCDEIFGPVCVVNRFESEEEVVGREFFTEPKAIVMQIQR